MSDQNNAPAATPNQAPQNTQSAQDKFTITDNEATRFTATYLVRRILILTARPISSRWI